MQIKELQQTQAAPQLRSQWNMIMVFLVQEAYTVSNGLSHVGSTPHLLMPSYGDI